MLQNKSWRVKFFFSTVASRSAELEAATLIRRLSSGCSSSPAPSLWRRTCGWCCTTTTCSPKTRRSARPWSTWRTASCPNTEPRAACRRPTACEWTHPPDGPVRGSRAQPGLNSRECPTLGRGWTSGGTSWRPGSCWTDCVSDETWRNPCLATTRSASEDRDTRLQTSVS